jgi:hypothetical protein
MRVRGYIDGFNLYYGGKGLAAAAAAYGAGVRWKWLDLRRLLENLCEQRWRGRRAVVEHVIYCTARVLGRPDAVALPRREPARP